MAVWGLSRLFPWVCGPVSNRRLTILIYHRVLAEPDYIRTFETEAVDFEWQMELVSRFCNPLPLDEALNRLEHGTLPAGSVCVTFDDGYADNVEIALPILQKWKVPAAFFIASGYLNGGRMWNDTIVEVLKSVEGETLDLTSIGLDRFPVSTEQERRSSAMKILVSVKHMEDTRRSEATEFIASHVQSLPQDLMMTTDQLKRLGGAAGMEIGGHTVTHPILAKLSDDRAMEEISEGKRAVEKILGREIRYFAYPNGKPGQDYSDENVKMIFKAGFKAALSTRWGVSNSLTDRWQLPRFTPWDSTPPRFMARLLLNYRDLK